MEKCLYVSIRKWKLLIWDPLEFKTWCPYGRKIFTFLIALLNSKKKYIHYKLQNLSYESAYNDDDFGFGSVENNSRTYSPEDHHRNGEDESKTINRQHRALSSVHPKESAKKEEYYNLSLIYNQFLFVIQFLNN